MSNPHFEEATKLAEESVGRASILSSHQAIYIAMTQAQATLALAYEQRTANLIAFYGDGPSVPGDDAYHALNRQIVDRLGLA